MSANILSHFLYPDGQGSQAALKLFHGNGPIVPIAN